MLGKIIKYDFKATCRFFIPMYIGLIVMSFVNKLFFEISYGLTSHDSLITAFSSILILIYCLTVFTVLILTEAFIVWHFYKNMTGDEGYLMLTLPVKASTHIIGKTLVSIVWQVVTIILVFTSMLLFASGHGITGIYNQLIDSISELITTGYVVYFLTFLIQGIIAIIIALISGPLMFYVSIAIGQLMGKYRIIGSIASYIGLYIFTQFIATIFSVIIGINSLKFTIQNTNQILGIMNIYFIVTLAINIILTIGYYLVTNYIFNKKINLE